MTDQKRARLGFTCAYTPLPLIHAAGFIPYRILPVGDAADQAGTVLHDNICPHVKRILDRAMDGDLPDDMQAVVIMESCDAMRRLADAWSVARPEDTMVRVGLPVTTGSGAEAFFARELGRLLGALERLGDRQVSDRAIRNSARLYDRLATGLSQAAPGKGHRALQELYNLSVTASPEETLAALDNGGGQATARPAQGAVPVYLFGNVLPDPDAMELLEECGARVVGDDLCTAARQLVPLSLESEEPPLTGIARALLNRPPCARTITPDRPGLLSEHVAREASRLGARGVIAHVIKFCDPYLNRMPDIQRALEETSIPLLVLEGDCTLRSLGQHRTRIEAFIEMLETT